ncbi:MAG: glycine cleavage system protein GcvH [Bacteroidales bacterium]|jgi:glycine cleavage system H protein|nr:glycine cleavage system protein GcvH [Bacteroidales bacterium]
MNFPDNLKYTREHEWIRVEGKEALVGITDYAQHELGDVVFVDVDTAGETLSAGDRFGTVEAVKTVSDLFMPVGGTVLTVNPALDASPELVNKAPYDEGWIIRIEITDADDLETLLDGNAYREFVGQ